MLASALIWIVGDELLWRLLHFKEASPQLEELTTGARAMHVGVVAETLQTIATSTVWHLVLVCLVLANTLAMGVTNRVSQCFLLSWVFLLNVLLLSWELRIVSSLWSNWPPFAAVQSSIALLVAWTAVLARRVHLAEDNLLDELDAEFLEPMLATHAETSLSARRFASESELTPQERSAVSQLRLELGELHPDGDRRPLSLHRCMQVITCRATPQDAAKVWKRHLQFVQEDGISQVSEEEVMRHYRSGFCVLAGRDFDGRPMVWIRVQYLDLASMSVEAAIRNTWMCLDAVLQDADAVRNGVCFVYDMHGIGPRNVTTNPFRIQKTMTAMAFAHPSHVAKVMVMNPPLLFWTALLAARPVIPAALRNLIGFLPSGPTWHEALCDKKELPGYLGGSYPTPHADPDIYYKWLCRRLDGCDLPYRLASRSLA